jgi:putative DNA primase/helicase
MLSESALTDDELKELAGDPERVPGNIGKETNPDAGNKRAKSSIPSGFRLADSGLWLVGEDDEPDLWICDKLEVIGMTRDDGGESWGRLLQWRDADGRLHSWPMPLSILAGDGSELRARLLDGGLNISPTRKARDALIRYLQDSKPEQRSRCTSRVGWHGESFVLPDVTIGEAPEEVVYQGEGESLLRQSATLEEWKESVGKYCVGNSRLLFAVSVALAGPLLNLCDEQSGAFHFVSPSSTGKSTMLEAAGSVLGGGGKAGFCQSWRAAGNSLEALSESHNDLTLILDELSQCDPKEAGEVAYMIANGSGKSRMRAAGGLRRRATWRLLFLSAGEISLADHLSGIGRKTRGGQEVRLLNLPADAGADLGCFEQLHGFPSPDSFARHLQEASKRTYGAPIRHFLQMLTANAERIAGEVSRYRRAFIEKHVPEGASGEVSRAAGRFSLVAAAGELGIEASVLPWPESAAEDAAAQLFREWFEARGTSGAADIQAGIRQVRLFLEQFASSRFEKEGENRPILGRAGFLRQAPDGTTEYLFLAETFKAEVCKGYHADAIARALADRGFLLRGEGDRLTSRVRIGLDTGADNRISVYRVSGRLLCE